MAQKLGQTTVEQVGKGKDGEGSLPRIHTSWPGECLPQGNRDRPGLRAFFVLLLPLIHCHLKQLQWAYLTLPVQSQITHKDVIMPQLPITQATQHRRVTSSVLSCYQLDTRTVKSQSPSNALLWHWLMSLISVNKEFLSGFSFTVSLGVRKANSLCPCARMHTYAYLLRHTCRTHILCFLCFHACSNVRQYTTEGRSFAFWWQKL